MKILFDKTKFFRYTRYAWLLVVVLYLAGSATVFAGDIKVSARFNSDTFPVDEAVLLSVTVQGASSAQPPVPAGEHLQFTYRGQSSQMQWINGKTSSTITFSYMVQADTPGTHTLQPVKVSVEGREYTSNPLTCTVLPARNLQGSSAAPQAAQGSPAGPAARLRSGDADKIGFMRITPEHDVLYSGQLAHITIKAFFRKGLRVTINSNPHLLGNNFILHSLDEKPLQQEEMINQKPYVSLTWQGTLSAVKEGKYPLEFELDASLLVKVNNRPRNDPFGSLFGRDPFFDDFFASYSKREVKLASPKKSMTIRDLPAEGKPADFHGAIGQYSLAVAASPVTGQVGDPITLKMVISGTGNFDLVSAPKLSDQEHWKTYPPTENYEEEKPGQGKKHFEQAIVPTSAKIRQIGPVLFSYFDPDRGEYVSLHSDPIAIKLQQTGNSPKIQSEKTIQEQPVQSPVPAPDNNLAPIHTELGKLVQTIKPLYQKSWFIILTVVALLMLLTALYLFLRQKRLADNPHIILQKNLSKSIKNHLQKMEEAIESANQDNFINHCRQAIQEHLALQWGMQARAITLADLEQRLGQDNPLPDIFRTLDHNVFSGNKLSRQAMTTLMDKTKKELTAL